VASMQKLGKTGLQTLRSEDLSGFVAFDVFYGGAKLGRLVLRRWGASKGKYIAFVVGLNEADGRHFVGIFNPADYKSRHACRKAAAEAIVVAHDKLIDGEPL
jgi:hypothetical protein